MNAPFTQDTRRSRLSTELGEDVLVLLRMNGTEEISGNFEWRVEALSIDHDIKLDDLLGTHATVSISSEEGERFFDGIVAEARWAGAEENGSRYDLVLRPWLHVAGLRRNNRIFHNMTVDQIVSQVLDAYSGLGGPHFELRLVDDYPELEYTVQYNESDAAFVQRMLERFGISWSWEHTAGNHTMVATDSTHSHAEIPNAARPYFGIERLHLAEEEHFHSWKGGARMTTGAVRLTEYNFKIPTATQEVEAVGGAEYAHGQMESFDWPGDYLNAGEGQGVVARRVEAEEGQTQRAIAKGNITTLGAGLRVTLKGDPIPNVTGKRFICLQAHHSLRAQVYGTQEQDKQEKDYEGTYVLMPDTAPFRPERRTPMPRIHGPQTAMVVGDGEIDCDEYGRILVQFHWDLDAAWSMRCRVMQHSASQEYGGMVIPRIGMEAVVEFLEGDPDKPLVTGSVYNGKTDRPYVLPAHKTKHVIRADSHEGQGFNEISFEAQAGEENMQIHAQKDQTTRVLNDQSANVGSNRVENIGLNASLNVAANQMERIGANKSITVGGMGGGLLKMLQPLVQAGGKFMQKGVNKSGSGGGVGDFAGIVAGVSDLPNELAAITSKGQFSGSGQHRSAGGADQLGKASMMGRLLSMIMPASGTMNLTVERFKKETIGQGSTEQVGVAKNVLVGNVLTTSVGKMMDTKIGESYDLEAKKSIFNRTTKHTLHAKEKFVIGGPGGTIIIDNSGVTIKTKHLKVKSPKVDFTAGAPDQVDALKSDKPFAQDCKGK